MESLEQLLGAVDINPKLSIQISGEDLVKFVNSIKQEKPEVKEEKQAELLFTRKETAKKLHITLPTLHKYDKDGLIKSVRIGRRVLYSETEILNALKERR